MPVFPPSVFPSAASSSSPSATVSMIPEDTRASAKELAWQIPVYLVGASVIVALISVVILIMWNDHWKSAILSHGRRRVADLRRVILSSTFILSPAKTLVDIMLSWFSTTLLPAFRNLRRVTAASEGSATPGP